MPARLQADDVAARVELVVAVAAVLLAAVDEAGGLLAEALRGLRGCSDEDPRLHAIGANLAEIRHMQGKLAEAEALYREAYSLRRKALGDVHPMTKQLAKLLASPLQPL